MPNKKLDIETMEPLIVLSATGLPDCEEPCVDEAALTENQAQTESCSEGPQKDAVRIVGTERDDTLIGTQGADIILGKAGDDIIYGDEADVPHASQSNKAPNELQGSKGRGDAPFYLPESEYVAQPQQPGRPEYSDEPESKYPYSGDGPKSGDYAEPPGSKSDDGAESVRVYGSPGSEPVNEDSTLPKAEKPGLPTSDSENDAPGDSHHEDYYVSTSPVDVEMSDELPSVGEGADQQSELEPRSFDGSGNNLLHPEFGAAETELLRLADNDDTRLENPDLPSPREISNIVHAQGEERIESERGLTDYAWVWGQFIDHDITLTEGRSGESANIEVPQGDRYFDPQGTGDAEIEFGRSSFELDANGERQQVNDITAFVDASQVYGSSEEQASELREFSGGLMRLSEGDNLPFDTGEEGGSPQFLAGDVRAGENVALTSMHTIFAREHNRIATMLADSEEFADADLSATETDEAIYQRARNIVAAQMQHITYNDFLPAILGENALSEYQGYNPHVDPSIANEFSTAAFRFGHTMLSSELLRIDEYGETIEQGNLALRDSFFRPDRLLETGVDPVLRGLAEQTAQEIDPYIVDDVRNFLFGPPGSGGFDLASLNIQRGRDHELPSYNDVREALGMERAYDFSDVSSDPKVIEDLRSAYECVDDMDLWTGGLAEDHVESGSVGETFYTIISDQFERLRDGDRYWYERSLSSEDLNYVKDMDLAKVIRLNSGAELEGNVFLKDSTSDRYV